MKNLLIAFGLLDVISFARLYKTTPYIYDKAGEFSSLSAVMVFTILSLLISGVLSMMKSKFSLYGYYVHFPLRIDAAIFTFSFVTTLFAVGDQAKGMDFLWGLIIALEIIRLAITIFIHKKYFWKEKTQVVSVAG